MARFAGRLRLTLHKHFEVLKIIFDYDPTPAKPPDGNSD